MNVADEVRKAKKGDKEALLQLIVAEKDAYYRLAYSYMRNEADAMDALEDMIVKLYEKIGGLKTEESFYSWSKTILANRCRRTLKRNKKIVPIGERPEENAGLAGNTVFSAYRQTEDKIDLQTLMGRLNVDQSEAIRLKYVHDLDYATISAMTGVSTGTVKSRIFNGLRKLRALYGRDRDD